MISKLLTVILMLSMLATANAATTTGLKSAFDELNYALSVEWDQSDRAFYNAQMKKFTDTVSAMQADGLTNSEIIEFVKSEVKNATLAKDLETAFNMISINKMSHAEASQYMIETMKKSYARGASWNYEVTAWLITGVIVVGFALLIVNGARNSSGTTTVNPGTCTSFYQCQPFCYNDALWGYTCQQQCFWSCF